MASLSLTSFRIMTSRVDLLAAISPLTLSLRPLKMSPTLSSTSAVPFLLFSSLSWVFIQC